MRIIDKMLKAYFHVAETIQQRPLVTSSKHYFHRTKKVAFSVMAEALDADGFLPGEHPFVTKRTKKRGL